MSIFTKLSTVIKSNINDLISRSENPEKMLNQIILDMRDQLAKAKREVAVAIADERKLRASLDAEVKEVRQWEHRAVLAVKEGRDDMAKQALVRQQEHKERASTLDETWRTQAAEMEKLKGSLRQLNDKIEEAKRKRNLLVAKQRRAQAQRRIHETMSGLSNTSAFDAFERMADKIDEQERESLAHQEVNEALGPGTLEDDFKALESGGDGGDVEDRLLSLKQEMGLIAAPEGEAPMQLESGEDDDAAGAAAEASAPAEGSDGAADSAGSASSPPSEESVIHEATLIEELDKLETSD
ncbi:MAG: PspA/IM30 family protein [Gemmatimonadota bacterium]|nr:PspA/IM30 family protein [Gemmatimonadota bacterium]